MRLGEILDVNVIADRGSVRSRVVDPIDVDVRSLSEDGLQHQGDEVRFGLVKLTDLAMVADLARARGLLSVADNTFATPWVQRPLESGFDVALHSVTKYLNGHSDMVGGAIVVGENRELAEQLAFLQNGAEQTGLRHAADPGVRIVADLKVDRVEVRRASPPGDLQSRAGC